MFDIFKQLFSDMFNFLVSNLVKDQVSESYIAIGTINALYNRSFNYCIIAGFFLVDLLPAAVMQRLQQLGQYHLHILHHSSIPNQGRHVSASISITHDKVKKKIE